MNSSTSESGSQSVENRKMTEIRIKPKNLLIFATLTLAGLFLIARRSNCFAEYGQTVSTNRFVQLKKQPTIYAITPTYARPVQKAELTRLVSSSAKN